MAVATAGTFGDDSAGVGGLRIRVPEDGMADRALDIYLNDHLAGATMGQDLADRLASRTEGTPFGSEMATIAREITEDKETLENLMEAVGTTRNPVKQGLAWISEKASRLPLSGAGSGDSDMGTFLSLETLSLGVEGKIGLWQALDEVADRYPAFADTDFGSLTERGQRQRAALERERMEYGSRVLREDEDA